MKPNFILAAGFSIIVLVIGTIGCSPEKSKEKAQRKASEYLASEDFNKTIVECLKVLQHDANNVEALRRLGHVYFEQGKYNEAAPIIIQARRLATNDVTIRMQLAKLFMAVNNLTNARNEAIFVLEKAPDTEDAILMLSDSSVSTNDIADTRARLDDLRQKLGDKSIIDVALAGLELRQGNLTNAETILLRGLAKEPKSVAVNATLGRVYWAQQRLDEADKALRIAAEGSPMRSLRRLRFAEFKFETGAIEEGKKIIQEILAQAPDYIPAWFILAQRAFDDKKYEECEELLAKLLIRHPRNFDALLLRARIKLIQKNIDVALSELEKLDEMNPNHPMVNFYLANAYLQKNNVNQATIRLRRALSLNPDLTDASLLLAELDLRRGDARVVIESMEELKSKNPNLLAAYLIQAEAYRQQGNFDKALEIFEKLSAATPEDSRFHVLKGSLLLQMNRQIEGRQAFEKARELSPDNLQILDQLVTLDLADGQQTNAFQRIQKEMERRPEIPTLNFLLARVYLSQKQYDEAEKTLKQAIEIEPDLPGAHFLLAQIYLETQKTNLAIASLEEILARHPDQIAALIQLGDIYRKMNERPKAAEFYERVLKLDPNNGPVLNNLAYYYLQSPETMPRAYELAKTARERLPESPSTADTLGWVIYHKGEYAHALALIREAVEKLPRNAEIQYHLGMTYYMLDQQNEAKTAFDKALQLSNDFDGRLDAEERLRILNLVTSTGSQEVIAELENWLSNRPEDPVASLRLASLYEKDAALDKAYGMYQKTLSIHTNNALAMAKIAQIGLAKGEDAESMVKLARKARELAPNDNRVLPVVGQVAYKTGDYQWAASLLQESVRHFPNSPEVAYDLALSYFHLGQLIKTQTLLGTLIQENLDTNYTDLARKQLNVIEAINDPSKALRLVDETQAVLKTNANDLAALMIQGLAKEQQGDPEAVQIYEKVYALYPSFTPVYKRLLVNYSRSSATLKKANEIGNKARQADPADPEVAKYLGIVALGLGDNNWAVTLLQEGARKLDKDAESHYYLGKALFQLEKKEESKTSLDRSIEFGLTGDLLDDAKQILKQLSSN